MVQKYQNEIAPIFYYGISTKTNEKDLKIPNLQALTLGRIMKIGIGCDGFHILDWRNFEIRCSFNSHRSLEEISFAHQVLSPSTVINKYNNGPDHDDCIHKHKLNN